MTRSGGWTRRLPSRSTIRTSSTQPREIKKRMFVAGQPKLDYKFAPKANRRPSQSRASLKNPRKTEVYEARKIDYGEKFGGLRASVEFLAGNSHSKPRLLD